MAKKTAKKQPKKEIDKKAQAKAAKAAFIKMEDCLLNKLSEEEFSEYHKLSAGMSAKNKMFCFYLAKSGNASEAARSAGYSVKSARKTGSRLRTNEDIRKFQEFLRVINEGDLIADIAEIMKHYTRILRREEKEYVPVTVKERKSWFDKNGKKKITDKERVEIVEIPAKLSDVNHAADSMMKRWGAFKENVTVSGTVNNKVDLSENTISTLAKTMTLEDMAATMKAATEKINVDG